MQLDNNESPLDSDEELSARILAETREKILKKSKPIDLDALRNSMLIPEPSHLGNLCKGQKTTN